MKTKNILLIDDNEVDNYVSRYVITKSKIAEKIISKNSAIAALEFLESVKDDFNEFPDIIFLDISMPTMDGFEFLDKAIRFSKIIEKKCFVIMLTSSENKDDVERAYTYGPVANYFVKPLNLEKIDILLSKN